MVEGSPCRLGWRREFALPAGTVRLVEVVEVRHVEEYIPSVIEPSFGIGRIMYALCWNMLTGPVLGMSNVPCWVYLPVLPRLKSCWRRWVLMTRSVRSWLKLRLLCVPVPLRSLSLPMNRALRLVNVTPVTTKLCPLRRHHRLPNRPGPNGHFTWTRLHSASPSAHFSTRFRFGGFGGERAQWDEIAARFWSLFRQLEGINEIIILYWI